mmetsp:Transcript_52950/g.147474  ORF Transcript_52950/g.147474 Transcript_52950/m.147474 type:complete len:224 (-) Transcript_52950:564-1235(-)
MHHHVRLPGDRDNGQVHKGHNDHRDLDNPCLMHGQKRHGDERQAHGGEREAAAELSAHLGPELAVGHKKLLELPAAVRDAHALGLLATTSTSCAFDVPNPGKSTLDQREILFGLIFVEEFAKRSPPVVDVVNQQLLLPMDAAFPKQRLHVGVVPAVIAPRGCLVELASLQCIRAQRRCPCEAQDLTELVARGNEKPFEAPHCRSLLQGRARDIVVHEGFGPAN